MKLTLSFDELDASTQRSVLEKQSYRLADRWEADLEIDEFKEKMEAVGFSEIDVQYSGWSVQGSGASFTADIDFLKFIKATGRYPEYRSLYMALTRHADYYELTGNVARTDRHYCHEYTVAADLELHAYSDNDAVIDKLEKATNDLEANITEFVRDASRALYREIESSFFDSTSDEAAKEYIEESEYRYYPCGCKV